MTRVTIEGQAKAEDAAPLGLYVHVPFCASTCDFCAFYQVKPTADSVRGFIRCVGAESSLVGWDRPVSTVFWGGGTPGLLSPADLGRLSETVRSVPEARLSVLKSAGVTRVSLGVQSFRPALLEALGRAHTRDQVYRAYERVRAAGFASVNLDLMFALPGQTASEWDPDIADAVSLAPDHISTYCLTFEEDTRLWVKLSQGRVRLDTENEARMYESTWERLGSAGYAQYEISNFARAGHACLHNVNTWMMGEWVGLGPSAASQHLGWRGSNVADLGEWAGLVARGERMSRDRVALAQALLAEDALVFGLRMNAGVDIGALRDRCPGAAWDRVGELVDRLAAEGLVARDGPRVRLEPRGRLLADSIGSEIMVAFDRPAPVPAG